MRDTPRHDLLSGVLDRILKRYPNMTNNQRAKRFGNPASMAVTAFGIAAVLAQPTRADAEIMRFQESDNYSPETAVIIRDTKTEQRFFGRLETKDQTAYYSVTASKDTELQIELDTPKADGDFEPTLTFFGPGLAKPKEDPVIMIGEDNGAIISRVEDRGTYFDRSVFTSFFIGPRVKIALPEKATYDIAIRASNGKTGRYTLRLKGKDDFKWSELTDRIANSFKAIFRMY